MTSPQPRHNPLTWQALKVALLLSFISKSLNTVSYCGSNNDRTNTGAAWIRSRKMIFNLRCVLLMILNIKILESKWSKSKYFCCCIFRKKWQCEVFGHSCGIISVADGNTNYWLIEGGGKINTWTKQIWVNHYQSNNDWAMGNQN